MIYRSAGSTCSTYDHSRVRLLYVFAYHELIGTLTWRDSKAPNPPQLEEMTTFILALEAGQSSLIVKQWSTFS